MPATADTVMPAAINPDSTAFVRLAKSMTELLTVGSSDQMKFSPTKPRFNRQLFRPSEDYRNDTGCASRAHPRHLSYCSASVRQQKSRGGNYPTRLSFQLRRRSASWIS